MSLCEVTVSSVPTEVQKLPTAGYIEVKKYGASWRPAMVFIDKVIYLDSQTFDKLTIFTDSPADFKWRPISKQTITIKVNE